VSETPLIGVLLTGGASRRLGTDKAQLVAADGRTLAVRAAELLGGVCDECVEVGDGHSGLPSLREAPPGSGPLAALLAGVDALGARGAVAARSVVLLGCDYPRLDAAALDALVAAAAGGVTAIATAAGRAHYVCACYSPEAIGEARRRLARGERALRWIESQHHVLVAFGAEVLHDVDTPADAAALGLRARPDS